MELENSYGRIRERIVNPERDKNSTRRQTDLTNLDLWGSLSLNHQLKSINRCDLGFSTRCVAMWSLIFMNNILNNGSRGHLKTCCLYVLLVRLPCLTSMGEKAPTLPEIWSYGVARYPGGSPTHSEERKRCRKDCEKGWPWAGMGGRTVNRIWNEWISEKIKLIKK